jgi:hypothetical protein
VSSAHDRVINSLQLLSSKEAQYDLLCRAESDAEPKAPFNLADDLWLSWIEKAYQPHQRAFASAFSTEALESLERFAQFFHSHRPLIPRRFESLMTDVHWLSVIEYANVLLEQLARNGKSSDRDG